MILEPPKLGRNDSQQMIAKQAGGQFDRDLFKKIVDHLQIQFNQIDLDVGEREAIMDALRTDPQFCSQYPLLLKSLGIEA
jgi:HD-GYP domain-containing protein (c-di-GMP phosphodiesterase class II)